MTGDTTYVIDAPSAWGTGSHETAALKNAAPHIDTDGEDTIDITIVECRGFDRISALSVEADEIVSTEDLALDADAVEDLKETLERASFLAEEILVEAE